MKLEIDIPSIIYNDAKENRGYISVGKMEIAWKAIADGKPLEKESTTKNDLGVDAVSRQEVLYLVGDYDLSMGQVVKGIHALPSITLQEPKTGKWINTETKGVRYAFWCRYKCSLCGGLSDHTNFCPNCGAKMESEDKE